MVSDDVKTAPKRNLMFELSTPATIALFVVVGVSGIMLLLKVGAGIVKEAHEWLGLAFVLVAFLHVLRHWQAMTRHFRTRLFWASSLIVAIITIAFMEPSAGTGHGNPMFAVVGAVTTAPIEQAAPVLGSTPQELIAQLEGAGIKVESPRQSLQEIANRSNRHLPEIISLVMPKAKPQ